MFAPEQALWKSLIHWLTAFAWALDPCALSEPEAHEMAALLPPLLGVDGEELLSEPHAASASVAVSVRQPERYTAGASRAASLRVQD